MKAVEVESTTAKYDLDLTLWETSDTLSGWLEFNTDLFDHDTVSRLLLRFQRCVAELVRQPLLPIHQLSFLSPEERREVVFEFNDTQADFPLHLPLHRLFAAQVARTPDAVAVVDACQQLTYGELDRRSDQLTHYLQARGVAPEVAVAVLLDRSAETLITLLAIYKAGGVYVPLDAAAPRTHLDAILRQTRPSVIVTSAAYADRLPSHTFELIRLEADWQRIAEQGSTRPAPSGVSVDNLAYVMYTSGSTAEPKGVAVEQRQLLNRLHWMWRRYPFAADEVLCQRTTAGFSVSMWEMLGGLLQGCRTVIVEDERAQDLGRLISEMGRQGVTRVVVVPSLLRALLEVEPGLCAKLSATRMWSVCGEALSAELAESFQGQAGGARLVNQYGASELNDVCFFDTGEEYGKHQESDAESEGSHRWKRAGMVPVGEPISNLSVYVLDARMRPVARGQRGEIYVRSISPARGYVGQAGATAERFVPDAVSGAAGGRLYRTGDVGRRVRGGRVEHLGRGDEQVKVRGVRVELKGVEALLRSHEGVAEAVVTARREGGEVTGLVGYVVKAAGGAGVSVRELREYVRERGGEQMVPAVVMELAEMPRLANGKVNRLALPDPLTAVAVSGKTFAAPRTKTEQIIAGIWQQVLSVDQVGVNHNFFEVGGHSLALARVKSKLQAAFNKSISMIELFKNPTVSALARYFNDEQVEDLTLQKAQQRAHKRRRAINR
jgi:amino acid adenylation domain-containing protein